MQGRFLLDIVIAKSASVFELFAGEDETLLVGWDALFVLDLGLDIVDCVGGFDFEGDGFAGEGFDEAMAARGCECFAKVRDGAAGLTSALSEGRRVC